MKSLLDKESIDFKAGQILLIDKPLTWSSFQVINKVRYPLRRIYNIKKFKVGHAGTLDPLATGLLVVCTGKMTKQIDQFVQDKKRYTGTIKLGATTPSFDLETEIDQTFETSHITSEMIEDVRVKFLGEQEQTPPVFSAKQVNGKRAYQLAREGKEVKLKKALINVFDLSLELKGDEVEFDITSSKGTYIRSFAYDLGKALNSGAHLTRLRRESSGDFDVANALTVDEVIDLIESKAVVVENQ